MGERGGEGEGEERVKEKGEERRGEAQWVRLVGVGVERREEREHKVLALHVATTYGLVQRQRPPCCAIALAWLGASKK